MAAQATHINTDHEHQYGLHRHLPDLQQQHRSLTPSHPLAVAAQTTNKILTSGINTAGGGSKDHEHQGGLWGSSTDPGGLLRSINSEKEPFFGLDTLLFKIGVKFVAEQQVLGKSQQELRDPAHHSASPAQQ